MAEERPEFITLANVDPMPGTYEQVTGADEVKTLTVPQFADKAMIQIEGDNTRFTDDGTAPSTLIGVPLKKELPPVIYEGDLGALKFWVSSSTEINVLYYKNKGSN